MDSMNFQYISGNYENLLYFEMLILLCDTFIVSNLKPSQKAEIIKIVKGFPESPVTMAVGSGIIDIMMMKAADISIAVNSDNSSSDIRAISDITVADLSSLIYLLLRHGIAISKKMQMNLCFSIFKTILLFIIITYSSVISSGSSTIMIAQTQYLLFNTFFSAFLQIFFGVFYKDIPFHFTHRLSYEYKGNISGSPISKMMVLSFLLQG